MLHHKLKIFLFAVLITQISMPKVILGEIVTVPLLSSRVTDLTGTLSHDQISTLENKLAQYETEKGSQIAVLLLPTTGDESIEEFGIKLADKWKIGRKGVDDGIILIIAKDDRKLRIEVGYGLEGSLTDVLSKRIINDVIVPHLKSDEYYEGISSGTDAIIAVISGEELPAPSAEEDYSNLDDNGSFFIFAFVIAIIAGTLIRMIFGPMAAFGTIFIISFIVGIFFLGFILSAITALILGVMAGFAGNGGGGGYSSGGGFSSGSFGGGGFSGGGGSFGGGGSSGSW